MTIEDLIYKHKDLSVQAGKLEAQQNAAEQEKIKIAAQLELLEELINEEREIAFP